MNFLKPSVHLSIPKEIVMVLLALISTGLVLFEITHDFSGLQYFWIAVIDSVIAGIFLIDFLWGWYRSKIQKIFGKVVGGNCLHVFLFRFRLRKLSEG